MNKVYLTYGYDLDDFPTLIGVFASRYEADKCKIAGELCGLTRYVEVERVYAEYDPTEDSLLQEELETSGTKCVGVVEDGEGFHFEYEDI